MSKSNVYENDLLKLIFHGTPIANLADNAGTSPLTNLYVSLHTADPGEAGDQSTNEAAYTGYARVAVARSSAGWTITNNIASPVNDVEFGEHTGGSTAALTHFGVGISASGAGKLLYKGALSASIPMANGVIPGLSDTSTISED